MPIALGGGGLFVVLQAQGISSTGGYSPVGPSFFPTVIGALMLLIAPLLALGVWRSHAVQPPSDAPIAPPAATASRIHALGWLLAAVAIGALGIERVGFVPAMTVAFVLAAQAFPGPSANGGSATDSTGRTGRTSRTLLSDFAVAITFALTTWFLFTVGLGLRLPPGWLSALPGA
jgi:putative tricarboxylic transport membrane protein